MNTSRHSALPPPSAPEPGPPTMDHAAVLMRDMRAEYDMALTENKAIAGFRREFHAKLEEQLHEFQAVEHSLAELEATHNKLRSDAENEIALLKSQLAAQQQQPHPQPPNAAQTDQHTQKDHQPNPTDAPSSAPPVSGPPNASPSRSPNGLPTLPPVSQPAQPSAAAHPTSAPLPPVSASTASRSAPHQPLLSSIHGLPSSDPATQRPLPSRLPAPLASVPSRTHPDPASATHPYAPSTIPSAFAVSRPSAMYQPPAPHPSLGPAQSHPGLPSHHPQQQQQQQQQYHSSTHAEPSALSHHAKYPRLVGQSQLHHMQLGPGGSSAPLPSPGALAGGPPTTIPSMMSNGPAPNGPRSGLPSAQDVQPMNNIMANGPQQQQAQDDRMMGVKGGRGRIPPGRGGPPHNSMLTSSRGLQNAIGSQGRPKHAGMSGIDDQSRGIGTTDDWEVHNGRAADGSEVNMNLGLQHSLDHDSVVCCVRYSWDGRYLATGSNRSAHIIDAATGLRVAKFVDSRADDEEGNHGDSYVRAVCFSPDGKWLITGAEDHVVKIWDVRNRTVKHRLEGHGTDIYSVDASANGRFIISGSGDKRAKLWNLETGMLLKTLGDEQGPSDGITSVSVSPTSQHVAAGSLDKIVRVWDVESARLVRQFKGHSDSVYSVAFSPDGRMLLSGSLDKSLKLWDLAASYPSGQCRLTFTGHADFVLSVAFSPTGDWLISGSKDRTVQFWDPRQSTMCQTLRGHKNSVISIAHNPQGNFLATGSGDCRARTWMYNY